MWNRAKRHERRGGSWEYCEALEPRWLLSFDAHINFQPAGTPTYSGYAVDSGLVFGARVGGMSYGWNVNNGTAVDRNSKLSLDQRYDTFIKLGGTKKFTWEIAVPNGTYTVHLVAGDAGNIDSTYAIDAEGGVVLQGKPTKTNKWVEGTKAVEVKDGRLTISSDPAGDNNKINYIDISAAAGTTPVTPPANFAAAAAPNVGRADLSWDVVSGAKGYKIERSTDGMTFAPLTTISDPAVKNYSDTNLGLGTDYYYRVKAYSDAGDSGPSDVKKITTTSFRLFDAMLSANKPDLTSYGLSKIMVAYEWAGANSPWSLLTGDKSAAIEANARYIADQAHAAGVPLILDIESWVIDIRYASTDVAAANLAKMIQIVGWIKSQQPDVKVGFYGLTAPWNDFYNVHNIPAWQQAVDFTRGINPTTKAYEASHDLLSHVDIIAPSLYLKTSDLQWWSKFSGLLVQESHRQNDLLGGNKKIYPFVWFQQGDGGPIISGELWSTVLGVAQQNTDGIIIWSGYSNTWDAGAGWWQATQRFLNMKSTTLAAPTNLAADPLGVKLSWADNASGELEYIIERSTDGTNYAQAGLAVENATTWNDITFNGGKTYYYRVRAVNSTGSSDYSNVVTVTAQRDAFAWVSAEYRDAAWSDTRFTGGSSLIGTWFEFAAMNFGSGANQLEITTATDGGATGITLTVHVDSLNGPVIGQNKLGNNQNWGEIVSQTLAISPTTGIHDVYLVFSGPLAGSLNYVRFANNAPPALPTRLAATASTGRVDLVWVDNSGDESKFVVERSTDNATFTQVATLDPNSTSYSDTNVSSGSKYYYRVRAVNSYGLSAPSKTATAQVA